jgi:23S rRNA pseudouridine2605 synthase/16S rRNA pseudouridine516 synthase
MAAAGVASRRVSEDLISAGRVQVNGEVVTELGRRVHPLADHVSVDGQAIQLDVTKRYLMLNKPVGIVSSLADENGRDDLYRWTARYDERLFNVGRLDTQTSGLLLLTNDGELAHILAHPSFGVSKTYIAKVSGEVASTTMRELMNGIELEDGPIHADKARVVGQLGRGQSMVEIELHSGRNRIVRRMLAAVGHPVIDLVRRQFGPLHLGSLPIGNIRDLTKAELGQLLTIARTAKKEQEREQDAREDEESGNHTGGGDPRYSGDQRRNGDAGYNGAREQGEGGRGAHGHGAGEHGAGEHGAGEHGTIEHGLHEHRLHEHIAREHGAHEHEPVGDDHGVHERDIREQARRNQESRDQKSRDQESRDQKSRDQESRSDDPQDQGHQE